MAGVDSINLNNKIMTTPTVTGVRVTVGCYAYDLPFPIPFEGREITKFVTCGTPPQVVYDCLHRGHNDVSAGICEVTFTDGRKDFSLVEDAVRACKEAGVEIL